MRIRKSVLQDLDRIMEIYAYARQFMAQHGNPNQWGPTCWPPETLIRNDIAEGSSYVCENDAGKVTGTFFFTQGPDIEPTYREITDGKWLDDSPYGVVHRIASDGSEKGTGAFCINWAFAQCGHLRMDTHGDNTVMQNLLRKLGFTHCGTIYVQEDHYPRLAYEKKEETKMEVLQAIENRRSHRVYQAKQIPEEALVQILKAGLQSPSARNHQPWHFSVVRDAALIQEVHDEAARMLGKNGSPRFADPKFQIFYYAPTVLFIFGEKNFDWTDVDCGIAVENMALAAEGLGIGSVILGLPKAAFRGEKADELRAKLRCPEGYDFVIALSLGYAEDTKEPHELHEEKISRIG